MCTPWHKQRLSVLSRSVGIPSLLVSGIQNGTEPPPLLFSLNISFREFGSLPSRKVQSSEVDEVFTRQSRTCRRNPDSTPTPRQPRQPDNPDVKPDNPDNQER